MKKAFLVVALFATSFGSVSAANNEEVNASFIESSVYAASTYTGKADVSKMNNRPLTGSYYATFDVDEATGDIKGRFSITGAHDFMISGNLYSGATGYVSTPMGNFNFEATFTNVSFNGNSVTFTCIAQIPQLGNAESIFTFTGTK